MEKIKKILKSLLGQIAIGVISTLIVNIIIEKITNFNMINFLIEKLLELLSFIWELLNMKVAIWIFIVISIVIIALIIIILKIKNRNTKEKEPGSASKKGRRKEMADKIRQLQKELGTIIKGKKGACQPLYQARCRHQRGKNHQRRNGRVLSL